ncbi:MAG: hypothetical protein WBN89_01500 [Prochlorococcaceae cyanobacterium]
MTPSPPAEALLRWGVTLLLPILAAFLLPVGAPFVLPRGWLTSLQVAGGVLGLIGLLAPLVLFPLALVVMFCAIFRGLLQILSFFTADLSCPDLPLVVYHVDLLAPLGLGMLLFATTRQWRQARKP